MPVSEAQKYIDDMYEMRGYILDFHKVLAAEDLSFLKSFNTIMQSTYSQRILDRKTKELILTAVLAAVKAEPDHIKAHLEAAKAAGASKAEMLEAIELILPPAGVPSFMRALGVWSEIVSPKRLEPTALKKKRK